MSEPPRELRLFVAAYEERSFTAAAARENATQSGVSQHIRKLEDRFGVRFFVRGAGSVTPTPAATAYYHQCLAVLRAHEEAAGVLTKFRGGLAGEIVVGLMPTMARCVLAPALDRLVAEHPNVAVRVVEAYSAALTHQVQSGELDFAIVPAFPGAPGLQSRFFARTPEVLVGRPDLARPHRAPATLAELGPLDLVLPGRGNTRRATLETYLETNGVRVRRVLELDTMFGTLAFVASTDWVAILPGMMLAGDLAERRFTVNPLAAPPLALDLVLISPARAALSEAASRFAAFLSDAARRIDAVWGESGPTPQPAPARSRAPR